MKKAYSKPEILFESFSLTINIAGDCDKKTNTPSEGACAYEYAPGLNIFLTTVQGCMEPGAIALTPGDDGSWNGLCYHVPVDTNNLFNS